MGREERAFSGPKVSTTSLERLHRFVGGSGDGIAGVVFRGGAISFLLATIGLVFGFATHVLLSRALGASQYGLYAIALGWCMIVATPATAGMDYAILRFAPGYVDHGRFERVRKLAWFVALIISAITVLIAAAFVWLSRYTPSVLGVATADTGWMALLVGASAILAAFSAFFRAARRIFFSQFYGQIVRSTILVCSVAITIALGSGLDASGAIMATALAAGAAMIALLVHFIVAFRSPEPREVGLNTTTWSWLVFGGASFLLTTLQQVQVQSSIIFVGWFSSSEQAGLYSGASRLAIFVTFGLSALASITAPLIVSAWERKDRNALSRIALVNARLSSVGAISVAIFFIVAGKSILSYFGAEFVDAYNTLIVLLIGGLLSAAAGASANLLIMTSNQWSVICVFFCSAIINMGISALLIPSHGAFGAAIAAVSGVAFSQAAMVWRVRRVLGVDATVMGLGPIDAEKAL